MNGPHPSTPDSGPPPSSGDSLEARLRRSAPAPPAAALLERLSSARPVLTADSSFRRRKAGGWKPLATAAALVLGASVWWQLAAPVLQSSGTSPADSPGAAAGSPAADLEFLPSLESRQHLISVRELGVARDSMERPVRLISTTWLDENTYGDPGMAPTLEEARLRHEIVPVLLPTY